VAFLIQGHPGATLILFRFSTGSSEQPARTDRLPVHALIISRSLFICAVSHAGVRVWSTTNLQPWICYLRDGVIDALPDRVSAILSSLGRFTKALPQELMSDPHDQRPPGMEETLWASMH